MRGRGIFCIGRVAISESTVKEAKGFVSLIRNVIIVVSPVKIRRYNNTKIFVGICR